MRLWRTCSRGALGRGAGVSCAASVQSGRRLALCILSLPFCTAVGRARASVPFNAPLDLSQRSGASRLAGGTGASTSSQWEQVSQLFAQATALMEQSDYGAACEVYDEIVRNHGDLALTEYARIGRAISRYEVGDTKRAMIELEGEVVRNVGFSEAHAALSAASWAAKRTELAEAQWAIVSEFEPRFRDLDWVRRTKHWGPKLIGALDSFLNLK